MTVEELRGCPLFRDIAPEDLQAMLGCLSAREAAPRRGDFILRTPDAHPLLGVVLEGEVEMISEDSFGKKYLLSVLPVGSIFGESYTCAKARNRTIAYQARTHSRVLLLTFTIPMGRTALAEYLCTDRSAMTRELARMRDEGLIDYTKRTFTLRQ